MGNTRKILDKPLLEIAVTHNVLVVDTDTGSIKQPESLDYFNVGICEQAAVGVAAGAAASGRNVLLCAFSAFASARAFEFIKLDIAYANRPVCIAGTHGGISGGWLGPTHHALEDTTLMSLLPNMTVLVPASEHQAVALLEQAILLQSPTYLRLGRKDSPDIASSVTDIVIGEAVEVTSGSDYSIIASGPELVYAAQQTAELLRDRWSIQVICVHSFTPEADTDLAHRLAPSSRGVLVAEESWVGGPLQSLAGRAVMQLGSRLPVDVVCCHGFQSPASHASLLSDNDLTAEKMAVRIENTLTHTKIGRDQ